MMCSLPRLGKPAENRAVRLASSAALLVGLLSFVSGSACSGFAQTAEETDKIRAAIPAKPFVAPERPRKLLIFTRNVGYGGHPSIAHANRAFSLMGEKTGAFSTEISDNPAMFARESLARFDAVLFNNTVGNCFTNADLRRNLQEFVSGGGGLLGLHGATVAFVQWPGGAEDWPEFGYMIGARGAFHKESTERVWVRVEDESHPLTSGFPKNGFEFRDEFFRFQDVFSRERLRVLLSIDVDATGIDRSAKPGGVTRSDHDYALAWVQNYGKGRVFYSTIAHNPYVFWDADILRFYLAAAQFALGDLPAPTTPSARLTPARTAQEKLGWRLGIEAYTFHKFTFFETIDKTRELGVPYVGGLSFQPVSKEINRNFDPQLSDDELEKVRLKLAQAGVRMLTYYIQDIPADEVQARKIFEFGRKMGIETFMSEPRVDALDTIERLADEYRINVALHNHDAKASPDYWSPAGILKACKGRSARIGACADVGYWIRSGIDPVEGVRQLGHRLITIQMHDLNEKGPQAHDVPWGAGAVGIEKLLGEMRRLSLRPTMIGLEYSYNWLESMPEIRQSAEFFDSVTLRLSAEKPGANKLESRGKATRKAQK
jgi:type 1 glutamine amidotransferase/sugar phosphate isomerase/epimerase